MLILVSGGSASGKSEFAEGLVTASGLETRAYLATMQVWDAESERRVERHRRMRAGKGFATVECPVNLAGAVLPAGCAALLEDLSNLTANEFFGPQGREGAFGRVLSGVCKALLFAPATFSIAAWATASFVTGLPGIIIQLVLLPSLVVALTKARLLRVRYA